MGLEVNEMTHMPHPVLNDQIIAYQYTTVWMTFIFYQNHKTRVTSDCHKSRVQSNHKKYVKTLKWPAVLLPKGIRVYFLSELGSFAAIWVCKSFSAWAEVEVGMSARVRDDNLCGRTLENDPRRSQATGAPLCWTGHTKICRPLIHTQTDDGDEKHSSTYHALSFVDSSGWNDLKANLTQHIPTNV